MKFTTLAIMVFGLTALVTEAAVAATPWQMHHKYDAKKFLTTIDYADYFEKGDAVSSQDSLNKLFASGAGHSFINSGLFLENYLNWKERYNDWDEHGWGKHTLNWEKYKWDWEGHQHFSGCGHHDGGSVVPIPASVWLFASALGFLGWRQRKSIV